MKYYKFLWWVIALHSCDVGYKLFPRDDWCRVHFGLVSHWADDMPDWAWELAGWKEAND